MSHTVTMKPNPVRLLGLLTVLVIGCSRPDAEPGPWSVTVDDMTIVALDGVLEVSDVVATKDRIYALSPKSSQVHVFSIEGTKLLTLGAKGGGPGEMERPVSIAVRAGRIFVCERSGRVSVFHTNGSYSHSFLAVGVQHMNSNIVAVADSTLLIGGYREVHGDPYAGAVAHLFETDGTPLGPLVEMTTVARTMRSTLIVGATCDQAPSGSVWCTQPMDYTLRAYHPDGTADSLAINPTNYRPLRTTQPSNVRTEAGSEWIMSFDKIIGIHLASDSLALIERHTATAGVLLDFINISDGLFLGSMNPNEPLGGLVDVEISSGNAYFKLRAVDRSQERLAVARISDLLQPVVAPH